MTESSSWHAAFLRGVNVGRGKRLSMNDLRVALEELGYTDVRTCLNSGNAVFRAAPDRAARHADRNGHADRIAKMLHDRVGLETQVIVKSAALLARILQENPLDALATNPSRFLILLTRSPADLQSLQPLALGSWHPDRLAIGREAAYLWCADGISVSALAEEVFKAISKRPGACGTTRNVNTLLKMLALMSPPTNDARPVPPRSRSLTVSAASSSGFVARPDSRSGRASRGGRTSRGRSAGGRTSRVSRKGASS